MIYQKIEGYNMKKQKTIKGVHKIEFYAALDDIREHYFTKGFVVYKILYETLKKKYIWEMSYNTFRNYAKKEGLIQKDIQAKKDPKYFEHIISGLPNEYTSSI